jgi:hypothetical protein
VLSHFQRSKQIVRTLEGARGHHFGGSAKKVLRAYVD